MNPNRQPNGEPTGGIDIEQLATAIDLESTDTQQDIDRPAPNEEYAYMAGVVDFRSNLVATFGKDSNRKIDYRVMVECRIKSERDGALPFFDAFFDTHDLPVRFLEHDEQTYTTYEYVLSSRQGVHRFLTLVRPYIIARKEAVELLCDFIIPALEAGAHQERDSFLELALAVDHFRELVGRNNRAKYDYDHFVEEWGMTASIDNQSAETSE